MEININAKNFIDSRSVEVTFEAETSCPLCKAGISPIIISAAVSRSPSYEYQIIVTNLCPHCNQAFITTYKASLFSDSGITKCYVSERLLHSEPVRFKEEIFDKNISDLSMSFVNIYNQALAAESYGLNEIAGMGYRKALEFLIKDFVIYKNPDDEETIQTMPLARCISLYIADPNIKTLAERTAWLGNDETHYVRKHEAYDINDMKSFITAITYFIGMILITDKAAAISPVR